MRKRYVIALTAPLLLGMSLSYLPAQQSEPREGIGQRLGEQLDRGLRGLRTELRQGWAEVRGSVEKLGVAGRVYSRLHWDKALESAELDIDVQKDGVVVLTGSVSDEAARTKAVQLANDTVGVEKVVDRLEVASQ